MANDLNAPEGFLVQARNGSDNSSAIVGTFLDPAEVRLKTENSAAVNYKILQCRRSEAEDTTSQLLDVRMLLYTLVLPTQLSQFLHCSF